MPPHTFEEALSAKAQIILYLSTVIDADLEILFQIYEYYKEFTLNSEREFQMNLYRGEEHPIVKLRKSNRTNYLEDLSASFHAFWNKGKDNESLRMIHESNLQKTQSKLIWLESFRIVLKNAFDIIGISAPESM